MKKITTIFVSLVICFIMAQSSGYAAVSGLYPNINTGRIGKMVLNQALIR